MLGHLFRKAISPIRTFGWLAGSLYIADRLMRRVSPRLGLYVYEFMVQPIGGKPLLPPNLRKNLTTKEIRRGDTDLEKMPVPAEVREARFRQGARCIGAYRKGQLVGYSWYCAERYAEDEVRFTYELTEKNTSIFDFDLYVLPEHRAGLGFLSVWHCVNELLAPAGVRYTFSRLTRFNLASRRAHAHLGWKRVGTAAILEVGSLQFFATTLPPFLCFTWKDSRRMKLRLRPFVSNEARPVSSPLESAE